MARSFSPLRHECDGDVEGRGFCSSLFHAVMSFNLTQEYHKIALTKNKNGAHMTGGHMRFDRMGDENYVQASRVARGT